MPNGNPLYLRVSVTDLCDLRCVYCMPPGKTELLDRSEILRFEEIERLCRLLADRFGLGKVRLTGGEPLVRRELPDLVSRLARIDGIEDLALTTNGQRLSGLAEPLRQAGLHRVNVSLDTLRPDRFAELTRGGVLQRTLDGIDAAHQAGLEPVRTDTVLLAGINDEELVELVDYGLRHELEMRFIELMRVGQGRHMAEEHFLSADTAIERIASHVTLTERGRSPGKTARVFEARRNGRCTRIGFIESVSRPFCADCNRLRLTSDGRLRWCLMTDDSLDVRGPLRDGTTDEALAGAIAVGLRSKAQPKDRQTEAMMNRIGG